MGHRTAKGRLFFGTLDVKMNPLMVMGTLGKGVNFFLGNQMPIRDTEFLTNQGFDIVIVYFSGRHI